MGKQGKRAGVISLLAILALNVAYAGPPISQQFSDVARRSAADVDNDGTLELVEQAGLEVYVYSIASGTSTAMPGWPQALIGTNDDSIHNLVVPAVGEVSSSHSGLEVVAVSHERDPPFGPPKIDRTNCVVFDREGNRIQETSFDGVQPYMVALEDVDGDGEAEIFIAAASSFAPQTTLVFALDKSGGAIPGAWPREVEQNVGTSAAGLVSIAIGDIDNNGTFEIVYTARLDPPGVGQPVPSSIFVLTDQGEDFVGWEGGLRIPDDEGGFQRPVLADLNNDNQLEIIVATQRSPNSYLHAYDADGTEHFERRYLGNIGSSPVVGDLDGDGLPEIVVHDSSTTHIFSNQGQLLNTCPEGGEFGLADVDGDDIVEIIFGQSTGDDVSDQTIFALRFQDVTQPKGWPIVPPEFVSNKTSIWGLVPTIADFDGNGFADILIGNMLIHTAGPCSQQGIQWSMYQGGPQHTGRLDVRLAADVNSDGRVDVTDLVLVILNWGQCHDGFICPADVDESGYVDVGDLLAVITTWSSCP